MKQKLSEEIKRDDLQSKHESDLTKKERRLLEKEKLKDMGFGKKLEYIWMYYKPVIFGIIAFIALIFLGRDIYLNAQKETVLSISVVNAGNVDSEAVAADIKSLLGFEDKNEVVEVAANLITNGDGTGFDYYTQMAYVTQVQTQALDVLVMPESLFEGLAKDDTEIFANLQEVLGDEVYAAFGENIDEKHLTLTGNPLKETFDVVYDPLCIAVMVNSKHTENAANWIASLAE
ncbi:hypothetical protein NXH76_03935 [Blautia schinkii]|nr:hypothetical protein [Blautia schinkii]